MKDPFLIEGPANVSFSGGRTSGYMLHRILEAHGGRLPADVHVLFANTGKERPETLDFVHDVETRWDVPIRWLEWRDTGAGFAEVAYETASRNGEPFDALIANPLARFCTEILKILPLQSFMLDRGCPGWWNIIGLRADEPERVATRRAEVAELWDNVLPLDAAGVTKGEVLAFWKGNRFDLRLQTWESNCALCFLKGEDIKVRIMRDHPGEAAWWIEKEAQVGATFRSGKSRNYSEMLAASRLPILFDTFDTPDDDSIDCFCTN